MTTLLIVCRFPMCSPAAMRTVLLTRNPRLLSAKHT
jgi:hypothetical protein